MVSYYVDSCVYLNLWRKEVDEYGNLLWKFAKEFFEKTEDENSIIYYSGYLLKELMFTFDEKQFIEKLELFNYSPNFKRITLTKEEYNLAKKIKRENFEASFYDIIHMLLAKQNNSILMTRDRLLMQLAKEYSVIAKRPEEIL
jgi:predicted nucleic acid-binding protein